VDYKVIKPSADGLIVRDPKTKKVLEATGEKKKMSSYWRRRLKDGSVVLCETKKVEAYKPETKLKEELDSDSSI